MKGTWKKYCKLNVP